MKWTDGQAISRLRGACRGGCWGAQHGAVVVLFTWYGKLVGPREHTAYFCPVCSTKR